MQPMERAQAHRLPAHDPIAGGPLIVTEIEAVESGITLRGRFEIPRFARLNDDQARYLETFLRCRGMLNSVEKELGISYPTARARLDGVLKALDLHAVREEAPGAREFAPPTEPEAFWESVPEDDPPLEDAPAPEADDAPALSRDELLTLLERGEITVEELKKRLAGTR